MLKTKFDQKLSVVLVMKYVLTRARFTFSFYPLLPNEPG